MQLHTLAVLLPKLQSDLVAWLAFIYMHATGVLVGYDEFIRHMKDQ